MANEAIERKLTKENVNTEALKTFLMDYADDIFSESIVTELDMGQLRSIFTTYCICADVMPDTYKSDMLLIDLYAKGERALDGAEVLDGYADAEYCKEENVDISREAFENYMYEHLC